MPMREPLPITMRAVVINPDADRHDEGLVVDVLTEEEVRGGVWARLMAYIFGQPAAGQRTTWLIVEFADGERVAYHRDEVRLTNVEAGS
jgi:hypothetical protein